MSTGILHHRQMDNAANPAVSQPASPCRTSTNPRGTGDFGEDHKGVTSADTQSTRRKEKKKSKYRDGKG